MNKRQIMLVMFLAVAIMALLSFQLPQTSGVAVGLVVGVALGLFIAGIRDEPPGMKRFFDPPRLSTPDEDYYDPYVTNGKYREFDL